MNFKDWLTEVSREELAKIGQTVNSSLSQNRPPGQVTDLLFDHLFGHNLRIVIPLDDHQERQVRHSLEQQGFRVDFQGGIAHSTVQTQRGPKERTERLGAVLKKLGSQPGGEHWLKTLNWWEKNRPTLARPKKGGVSIIVSRSPIDIVRMSDHSEWSSCHSPGNSYWKCAIQEARTGGAIAYVVRNSDLEQVPNLQAKDIFEDPDRDVDGIVPLERVRLRRFTGPRGEELLMPEVRTYGTKHVGFLDAVTDWARHAQRDVADLEHPPSPQGWDIHGGSYQDNSAGSLWNNFFKTNQFTFNKKSVDQPEEAEKDGHQDPDDIDDQAQEMVDNHNFAHYHVSHEVEDNDGEPYIWYRAYVGFKFPIDDFLSDPDLWNYRQTGDIKSEFAHMCDSYPGTLEEVQVDVDRNAVHINMDFYDENGGADLDSLEHFLDEIDDADPKYDEQRYDLQNALIHLGLMRDWRDSLKNADYRHFHFDPERDFLVSDFMPVGYLQGVDYRKIIVSYRPVFDDMHPLFFRPSPTQAGTPDVFTAHAASIFPGVVLGDEIEWVVKNPPEWTYDPPQSVIDTHHSGQPMPIEQPLEVMIRLKMGFDVDGAKTPEIRKKVIAVAQHIDQHWDEYQRRAAQYFAARKPLLMPVGTERAPEPQPLPRYRPPRPEFKQGRLPFPPDREGPLPTRALDAWRQGALRPADPNP